MAIFVLCRGAHTINNDAAAVCLVLRQFRHKILGNLPTLVSGSPDDETARNVLNRLIRHLEDDTFFLDLEG